MNEAPSEFIDVNRLRIGMFIELEMGWMAHPFPSGSFKISSAKQLEVIRGLDLTQVRYVPAKSDPAAQETQQVESEASPLQTLAAPDSTGSPEQAAQNQRIARLSEQKRTLMVCERRFGEAIKDYKQVVDQMLAKPQSAREQSLGLVSSFVGEMLDQGESVIRLLSEGVGDKAAMHPVNVTILCLLLGKSLGLPEQDMVDLGMAAFLHDMGKTQLPDRVRWPEENFSTAEHKLYQEHVGEGVKLARAMGLSPGVQLAMAQHHEMADGSGFPARTKGDAMSKAAKILALVNRYDNLCNPSRPASAMTPHEALALIFAQLKSRFDSVVLGAFIRMMGVYPPGSVVQLSDERYALVVSVNSSRPLKPQVVVFEPSISKHDALILDLEQTPSVGIRRSLKPAALPRAAMDYLSPRLRICYFFERAIDPGVAGELT
jgi:putative nucleotidyltransferase with HDIG domain